MSAKPFGKLREQLEGRPGGAQALERARKNLDAEVAAYEAGLAQLRRALNLTQTQLARQLGVTQSEVSRLERRNDLFLSTLQSYVEAMGGQLELVGVFDDTRVKLAVGELGDVADDPTGHDAGGMAVQTTCPWAANLSFEFSGDLSDELTNAVRSHILEYPWVISNAVAIRRGQYTDLMDVSFELEAEDEAAARQQLTEAVKRVVRRTHAVRRGSGLSVELSEEVDA